jgi:hypothetical protein
MARMKKFTVTEDHLKLLRRMIVSWDDGEYGAPAICCKRPYGNSSVEEDMHEILTGESIGTVVSKRDELTDAEADLYAKMHKEMKTVLQIVLSQGCFLAADYICEEYRTNWIRI